MGLEEHRVRIISRQYDVCAAWCIEQFITVRNYCCGKVMFPQAGLKNSVHGGGGYTWGVVCMARDMHGRGGVHGGGGMCHMGVCMAGGHAW